RAVQRLDEVPELVHDAERVPAGAVPGGRGEEGDRRIAPVVGQARRTVMTIVLEDRQEFDRGYPEILQIRDLLDHPGIRPACPGGEARARMAGEAPNMHLVDYSGRERPPQRHVTLPVVGAGI